MDNSNDNIKECRACKTTFIRQSDIIRHIKKFHPKRAENLISMLENKSITFKCDECDKQFFNRKNLNFHRKSHCGNTTGVKIRKKCPLCDFVASFKKDFYDHCGAAHNIILDIEKMNFASLDDFMNWKLEIEGAMNSKFVREYGSTAKMTNYICSQSEYDIEIGNTQEKKVNGFCPAGFRVMHEENGKCSIYFVKTHICYQNKSVFPNSTNEVKGCSENLVDRLETSDLVLDNINPGSNTNTDEIVNHYDSSFDKKSKYMKKKEFLVKKREMTKNVLSIVNSISNIAELEAVQVLINPIKPILGILQAKSREA